MKKFGILFFISVSLAILAWPFNTSTPVQSSKMLAITNTPSQNTPTPLPTEMLTAVPTAQPTNTPPPLLPTSTPVRPTAVEPSTDDPQPTPQSLPPLGMGEMRPGSGDLGGTDMRLFIPDLHLDTAVEQVPNKNGEWDISNLGVSIGWLDTTSRPDLFGNTVLVGHVTLKGGLAGPFYQLGKLKSGAKIVVYVNDLAYNFVVTQRIVTKSSDISALGETEKPTLTLVTCFQPSWNRFSGTYEYRQLVIAELDRIGQ